MVLFGSAARCQTTPDGDLDFLLIKGACNAGELARLGRNALPRADVTEKFSTVHEGQTSVSVRCMENTVRERGYVDLEASTEIGKAELRFARSVPKGAPLKFRFSLSDDGLLSVHATDLTTGGEVDISIQTAAILTADEVEEKKVQSTAITVS